MNEAERACGPESARGGVGWVWGDRADGIPPDASLHSLMLAASRVMGAFHASTLSQAGLGISPAGLGVLRVLELHPMLNPAGYVDADLPNLTLTPGAESHTIRPSCR